MHLSCYSFAEELTSVQKRSSILTIAQIKTKADAYDAEVARKAAIIAGHAPADGDGAVDAQLPLTDTVEPRASTLTDDGTKKSDPSKKGNKGKKKELSGTCATIDTDGMHWQPGEHCLGAAKEINPYLIQWGQSQKVQLAGVRTWVRVLFVVCCDFVCLAVLGRVDLNGNTIGGLG